MGRFDSNVSHEKRKEDRSSSRHRSKYKRSAKHRRSSESTYSSSRSKLPKQSDRLSRSCSSSSNSSTSPERERRKDQKRKRRASKKSKHRGEGHNEKTKKGKRNHRSSSSESSSSSSTGSSSSSSSKSKHRKKRRKEEKRLKKKRRKLKKLKKERKKKEKLARMKTELGEENKVRCKHKTEQSLIDPLVSFNSLEVPTPETIEVGPKNDLATPESNARSFAPMTKEMWEKQQSVIRRVYDEDTGRTRLVRGDGEILEEIVSQARHKEINRTATSGDGASFQAMLNTINGLTKL